MLKRFFAPSEPSKAAERLYAAASRRSRDPSWYLEIGVPDTVDGRFELLTVHIALLIDRLKGAPGKAQAARQSLFDLYVANLDSALREMGVGDLAVPKRMRRLGEVFYGRAKALDAFFSGAPGAESLEALLARTLLQEAPEVSAEPAARRLTQLRETLRRVSEDEILSPRWNWEGVDA